MAQFSVEISLDTKSTSTSTEGQAANGKASVTVRMCPFPDQKPNRGIKWALLKICRCIIATFLALALAILSTSMIHVLNSDDFMDADIAQRGGNYFYRSCELSSCSWTTLYTVNFAIILTALMIHSVYLDSSEDTRIGEGPRQPPPNVSYTFSETPRGAYFSASNMGRRYDNPYYKRYNNRRNSSWGNDDRNFDNSSNSRTENIDEIVS